MIEHYPLQWPADWPRSPQRKKAAFTCSFASARDGLIKEVKRLGGTHIIISSNIPVRLDGLPYAQYRQPEDPGIAVYFTLKNQSKVFACDIWRKPEHNLRAIQNTIAALRGIQRWGSSTMLDRLFRGFAALPASTDEKTWYEWLGLSTDDYSLDVYEHHYRALARKNHPDQGGSPDTMAKLNWAISKARNHRSTS